MYFAHPEVLLVLVVLLPLIYGLYRWGWKAKEGIIGIFPSIKEYAKKEHIEKYILFVVLIILMVVALAVPKAAFAESTDTKKTGEVILLVDVSTSMSAQADVDTPSRIERVKILLAEIVESMQEFGEVRICLCGFTDTVRSIVPFVGWKTIHI
jgi:hypothetical protein